MDILYKTMPKMKNKWTKLQSFDGKGNRRDIGYFV